MENVIFDTVCYIIEFIKILGALAIIEIEGVSSKRTFVISLLSILFFMSVSGFIRLTDILFGVTFVIILSIFMIIKNNKNTFVAFIIYMYICIIDMVINSCIMYITHVGTEQIESDKLIYILFNLPTLVVIAVVMLVKKIAHIRFSFNLNRYNLLILFIGGAAISLYITSLQLFAFSDTTKRYVKIATIAASVTSVIFMIVFFRLIQSETKNQNLKRENIVINHMLEIQKNYYLALIQQENATRAFRHDLGHHFFSLSALYKMDKKEEFENYFFSIVEKYNNMSNKTITGNNLIDVIINEMINNYDDVKFTKKGYVPNKLSISDLDICTIFSNILKNAFEAAEKTEEKKVNLFIGEKNNGILIALKNSTSKIPVMKAGNYVSDKEGNSHGYGIRNVKNCIDKLEGLFEMEYAKEDNTVTVSIFILNAIPINDGTEA
ncbi:MAG: GHKL domain-containing protein [Ruminococcus sp.]|nr:GHKL domain-containing protein [Ruminococcus sp.]